jgi:type IV pilus assembly protein PilM
MIGLDIGSKTIKIVDLDKSGDKFQLKASGIVGYTGNPPEKIDDSKEFSVLAGIVKKLHRETKISSRDVAIALPEPSVYTRPIKFPLLTDAEIASAVKWEAEQYIPIPAKDAIIQHEILEKLENTTPPQISVLLVAAPKKLVEKYAKVVELAGLKLVAVETELISLVRAMAPENQTVLLVDFGARSTDLAIAKNRQLTFSRSISTAGEAFTRAVEQGLGVEKTQAEQYKRTYGMSTQQLEGKIKGAITPVFQVVADEIKKSFHFYQTEEKGDTPKSAVLTGGTAGMPEAASLLTQLLGIEVVVGNPFARVEVAPEAVNSLAGYAPLYAIAVGLAMRED